MRPIDASPRSKRFTTQPSAIIGQWSMARYTPKATNSPRVTSPATTIRPPSHSTVSEPRPIRKPIPGWRMPLMRTRRRLRETYSSFAAAKRASSCGSWA